MRQKNKLKLMLVCLFLVFSNYTTASANTKINVNGNKKSSTVSQHEVHSYNFNIKNNWTYVVYLSVDTGDADLYERYLNVPLNQNYSLSSRKGGTSDDFFRFESNKSGVYQVSVSGYEKISSYSIYVIGFQTHASNSLKGKLIHPLSNNPSYTYSQQGADYGFFGAPWGNPLEEFLFGSKYMHHIAVDLNASHNTTVKAAHSGKVFLGAASTDVSTWGYYVQVEGVVGGKNITTTYMHLQKSGRPKAGSWIEAGKSLGKIYDVSGVEGEKSHLHFVIYQGKRASHTRSGSLKHSQFPKNYINPQDSTLYQSNNSGSQPNDSCGSGRIYDCSIRCVDEATAISWIGDNFCDNAQSRYQINLLCSAFNNDNGDCN